MIKGVNDEKSVRVPATNERGLEGVVPSPLHPNGINDEFRPKKDSVMKSMSMAKVMPEGSC